MGRRLRLGRMFGVEVTLDWSWIITFVLAAWTLVSLGARLLPGLGPLPLVIAGAASAGGLLLSLALHEIAHGLAARACGVPVRHVTLFLLGGITDVEREPASPRSEVAGALAAFAGSVGVGALLVLALAITSGPLPRAWDDLDRLGAPGVVVGWLAVANFAIAAVNMLPAYPLDGGRLVRAAIWRATGDVERATRWAAWSGQFFGWLLVVVGVALAFAGSGPGVALGMWTAFVGWFIASAAAQGYEDLRVQDALAGVSVARLMRRSFVAIPADLTVTTAMRSFLARSDGRPMPVVDGTAFLGLLSFRDVRNLPASRWSELLVREAVAEHAADTKTTTPRALVRDVLGILGDVETERIPVLDGTRLVGMLDRHDVHRWIEAHATTAAIRQNEVL